MGYYLFLLFRLFTDVRQGGVLSPTLFAIDIKVLIVIVTSHDACGKLTYICVSISLYAGDILLLSPSVANLQLILTYCEIIWII